ncbi:type I secretion system permease/ATPase [Methylobacterium sp. SyP6R]|uniref:type I secretion system permease/ATPase n=1 Tax=Methylobacterium sp. SyP6R TaxID=2718876 RepID=UPI001F015BB2|nr:type I secretion system permease/ATPase [Methylobacterium sp. SyP6R]MCF4130236.1 type I secretion system permease/ATPase [Methylobacterium sp. SyP6R]
MRGKAKRPGPHKRDTPLDRGVQAVRPALIHLCLFSLLLNLLSFSTVIYTMQVFDRVLSTRSISTLISLTILFLLATAATAILGACRASALRRIGGALDREVVRDLYDLVYAETLETRRLDTMHAFRDLETIRQFIASQAIVPLFDLPWIPIYLIVAFSLHVWLGTAMTVAIVVVLILAVLNEIFNRANLDRASQNATQAQWLLDSAVREAEILHVMSMVLGFRDQWLAAYNKSLAWQIAATHVSKTIATVLKFWQQFTSFGLVALSAYLSIQGQVSPGAMFAVMFISGACIGVVQAASSQWLVFLQARQAYGRLQILFRAADGAGSRMSLPRPEGRLDVSSLAVTAPGTSHFILSQVSFSLPAGTVTAVVGPSGAGKSTLVRCLIGIWAPSLGTVRLDGSELQHWEADALGQHLGYLPQSVELLSGTIAQNIARFGRVDDAAVLAAAQLAGVHEVIQQLPQGYGTDVGEGGSALSGGQRQRIGLARAIYGDPALVVLDEPNSNLDALGEAALAQALEVLKGRGTTCVLITHKANVLTLADYILVLKDGTVSRFGTRDEVLTPQKAALRSAGSTSLPTRHAAAG